MGRLGSEKKRTKVVQFRGWRMVTRGRGERRDGT